MDYKTKELKAIKTENDRLQVPAHFFTLLEFSAVAWRYWYDSSWMQKLREDYEKQLQKEAEELEHLASNTNMLRAKQEEYSKKIRELGALSSDAFETYFRILYSKNISDR